MAVTLFKKTFCPRDAPFMYRIAPIYTTPTSEKRNRSKGKVKYSDPLLPLNPRSIVISLFDDQARLHPLKILRIPSKSANTAINILFTLYLPLCYMFDTAPTAQWRS